MRTRTKWIVAGGAAAFVLTPMAAVYGSTALDGDVQNHGVVIEAQTATKDRATPAPKTSKAPDAEPTGKKTVSAASPTSPKTPAEAKASKSKTTKAKAPTRTWSDDSPDSPASPDSPG